jgi:ubiquinone biosynthesis protein
MVTRFQRYRQIADVLVKYGFGILVDEMIPGGERLRQFRRAERDERSVYERIRLAIEELGPTYIKFGQIMSTRRELLPPALIEELQRLQDRVAPVPYAEIRPVIRRYCPNLEDCFDIIEAEPVAAASSSCGRLRHGRNRSSRTCGSTTWRGWWTSSRPRSGANSTSRRTG